MNPTTKLRWGVLGAGNIAGKMLAVFSTCQRARAVAIASRSRERAEALVQKHGLARAHDSYAKLLADPDVDIIYNALHTGLHAEWSIRALEAGKHVLCEKPLARDVAEAQDMFAAARHAKRLLMEGFMYRFHPQMEILRGLLAQHAIGRVKLIRASYTNPRTVNDEPKWNKEMGGGALMDIGCYTVDVSRVITGAMPTEIIGRIVNHPSRDIDETAAGLLRFPGDRIALIHSSFQMARTHSVEIIGESGGITLPHPFRSEEVPLDIFVTRNGAMETITAPAASSFRLEMDYFSECVANHSTPVFPGRAISAEQDSLENMRVLDALRASAIA